jgi:hypothetical protein
MDKNEEIISLEKQYRQSCASIEKFVEIQHRIAESPKHKVVIDTRMTTLIAPGLLLLIAALPDFSDIYRKTIAIRYNLQNEKMTKLLNDSGILAYYNEEKKFETDPNSIPFGKSNNVGEYAKLVKRIMELAPVQFNDTSYSIMFSKLYEIFINAETHGKNELGTYTYGTLNKRQGQFVFAIYDAGVGIQQNVNCFLNSDMNAVDTMKWALKGGNSTLITDYPRGAGFTLLENFINKNDGKITLCSDNVICVMKNGKRSFNSMKTKIRGTLFIMNIKANSEYVYDIEKVV